MLEVVHIHLLQEHNDHFVFSQFNIQHFSLKIELSEGPMLDIVPENEPIRRVASVLAGAYETYNVGSEKHFTYFDPAFEV